jgi:hypothetical protein
MLRAVFIVLGLVPAAFVAQGAQVVEGRVLNNATGDGVPGATVRLFPAGDSEGPGDYEALTDSPLPSDNGDMEGAGVYPGTYEIRPISESPAPYYLDSVRVGEQDALGYVAIPSGSQDFTITYKLGGGTVRGSAEACGTGHPTLIPQDAALRRAGFIRVTDCDANGRFEFSAVRPGEYFALIAEGSPASFVSLSRDENVLRRAAGLRVRESETVIVEIQR